MSWRDYVGKKLPGVEQLDPDNETFQFFNSKSGEAIRTQILDTLTPEHNANLAGIFDELKTSIDAVADYTPRSQADLALAQIRSRTIHLAIPYHTAPLQWRHLYEAVAYAKRRGVSLVITRIRD